MTGGTGPSILTHVRYHTDRDITEVLRSRIPAHQTVELSDSQLAAVLAEMRAIAGTNSNMATGGFTGAARGGRGEAAPDAAARGRAGGARGAGAGARGAGARGGGGRGAGGPTIELADGRTLAGSFVSLSATDATVLSGGRFVLLAREGATFREKPAEPRADWSHYSGGYDGNRYSPLDQIAIANVGNLAPAWIAPVSQSRGESTPIVVDGIMYVTGWNELYAIDATTGRQLWSYSEPPTVGLRGDASGGANRGAAVSADRVFMTTDSARLLAFNRFTGQKVWDVTLGDYKEGYAGTAAPLVVGDLVLHGVSGGDEGIRGFIDAYRIGSGERAWRFYTVPERGAPGSETWIGQAIEHGCGATWLTGSYDPELDLTYWGTGNPCPTYAPQERLGDNLHTASVVAIVASTGELKWHYQFTPHDTHDWDAAQPMVLVDETWQGQPRKLLLNGNRNGMFYVLDRVTGEFLLAGRLATKVTWNLGFTEDGRPIVNPAAVATVGSVAACPAALGGTNWPPAAYSPQTKLFYARVSDSCGIFTAQQDDPLRADNRWMGGTARGTTSEDVQAAYDSLMDGYGGTFIRAMDPFTGTKVWEHAGGGSGVLATAGGLLFTAGGGGLIALDAKTGRTLWQVDLAQGSSTAPISYMYGGKQYIALSGRSAVVAYALPSPGR
jgi:alcohol dehydrogenase (cytochrome c)